MDWKQTKTFSLELLMTVVGILSSLSFTCSCLSQSFLFLTILVYFWFMKLAFSYVYIVLIAFIILANYRLFCLVMQLDETAHG